jgi:hypothetical protein
MVMV